MNAVNEFVTACRQRGIVMAVEGVSLRVEGPDDALTEGLLDRIKAHKAEILAVLTQPAMPVLEFVLAECEKAFGEVKVEWAAESGRTVGKRPGPPAQWIAPRETVRCTECKHFERDVVGDGTGVGACFVKGEGTGRFAPALWPNATRWCKDFVAADAIVAATHAGEVEI